MGPGMKALFTPLSAGLLSAGMMATATIAASAGPCTDKIEQIQESVSARLEQIVAAGPAAPESVGAGLHYQSTPYSIAAEESKLGQLRQATIDDVKSALTRARDADRLGDLDSCERALREVENLIRR
jgi:phage-related minor tail protein